MGEKTSRWLCETVLRLGSILLPKPLLFNFSQNEAQFVSLQQSSDIAMSCHRKWVVVAEKGQLLLQNGGCYCKRVVVIVKGQLLL